MSSGMQVILGIRLQKATEGRFVKHHDVVEALAAYRADEAFCVGILPRRLWRREHFADAHPADSLTECSFVNRVAIMEEVTRCAGPRERLNQLLPRPFGS